jgi:16S rRNA processing protein RimM
VSGRERDLLAVGSIVKALGLKGDVVVRPLTDVPDRFRTLKAVWLGSDAMSVVPERIEGVSVERRGVRIKFVGIEDRTAAEKLCGKLVFIEEADAIRLPAGRYFVHDVIGLSVRDEHGNEVGTVADVLRYPANDVYVVRGSRGEMMIPAVKEFVLAIDIAARAMTVRLIEGMME